jgi:hypothetical protein
MSEAAAQIGLRPREEKLLALIAGIAAPRILPAVFMTLVYGVFYTGDQGLILNVTTWPGLFWFNTGLSMLGAAWIGWSLRWRKDLLRWAVIGYAVTAPLASLIVLGANLFAGEVRIGQSTTYYADGSGLGDIVQALLPQLIILGAFIAGAWLRANRK